MTPCQTSPWIASARHSSQEWMPSWVSVVAYLVSRDVSSPVYAGDATDLCSPYGLRVWAWKSLCGVQTVGPGEPPGWQELWRPSLAPFALPSPSCCSEQAHSHAAVRLNPIATCRTRDDERREARVMVPRTTRRPRSALETNSASTTARPQPPRADEPPVAIGREAQKDKMAIRQGNSYGCAEADELDQSTPWSAHPVRPLDDRQVRCDEDDGLVANRDTLTSSPTNGGPVRRPIL